VKPRTEPRPDIIEVLIRLYDDRAQHHARLAAEFRRSARQWRKRRGRRP
jgi:hypothetical protein